MSIDHWTPKGMAPPHEELSGVVLDVAASGMVAESGVAMLPIHLDAQVMDGMSNTSSAQCKLLVMADEVNR